jgi:hypothetical protein
MTSKRAALSAGLMTALVGCHNAPCEVPALDEGDRFQLTVLAPSNAEPCNGMDPVGLGPDPSGLRVGNTFVLTAGAPYCDETGRTTRYAAVPPSPPFATNVLASCGGTNWGQQLGLRCTTAGSGCGAVRAEIWVAPQIERGVDTIDPGALRIRWLLDDGCPSWACDQIYDVRIERIAPPAEAGSP